MTSVPHEVVVRQSHGIRLGETSLTTALVLVCMKRPSDSRFLETTLPPPETVFVTLPSVTVLPGSPIDSDTTCRSVPETLPVRLFPNTSRLNRTREVQVVRCVHSRWISSYLLEPPTRGYRYKVISTGTWSGGLEVRLSSRQRRMKRPSRGTGVLQVPPIPQRTSILGSPDTVLTRQGVNEMSGEGIIC